MNIKQRIYIIVKNIQNIASIWTYIQFRKNEPIAELKQISCDFFCYKFDSATFSMIRINHREEC